MASVLLKSAINASTKGAITKGAKTSLHDVARQAAAADTARKEDLPAREAVVREDDWEGFLWEVS